VEDKTASEAHDARQGKTLWCALRRTLHKPENRAILREINRSHETFASNQSMSFIRGREFDFNGLSPGAWVDGASSVRRGWY
jgi:hypothetical protein